MLVSKFFRVAKEGATADGRAITAEQIDQMAANYSQKKYGARIWLEHFRGLFPDSIFKALGDVVELRATTDEDGKRVLEAKLAPTSDLIEMNKKRQKVYTSIEMDTNFGDTGEAYMYGLAVTDSPASMGTEMLQFSRKKNDNNNVFSDSLEIEMSLEDLEDTEAEKPSLLSKVKDLFAKHGEEQQAKDSDTKAQFADVEQSVLAVAEEQEQTQQTVTQLSADLSAAQEDNTELKEQLGKLQTEFSALKKQLEEAPQHHSQRPKATGGEGEVTTDC